MGIRCGRNAMAHGQVADAAALRLSSWALMLDVRVETAPTTLAGYPIICKGGPVASATYGATYYLGYRLNGSTLELIAGYTDTGGTLRTITGAYTLTPRSWYTVAVRQDDASGAASILVAARRNFGTAGATTFTTAGSGTLAGSPLLNTRVIRLGAEEDTAGAVARAGNVSVSNVALYSSAIAQATLEARIGRRLRGNETGLVAYWPLDDGCAGRGGSTAYDRSTNGYSATLSSAIMWTDDPEDLLYPAGSVSYSFVGWHSATRRPATVITASSVNSAYPVANLKTPRKIAATRTADVTGTKTLVFDFGAPIAVHVFALLGHNLTSKATITLEFNRSDSWGSPAVSERVTFMAGDIFHVLTAVRCYRFARLSIADTTNADGYLKLGLADFWHGLALDRYAEMGGQSVRVLDPSVSVETPHADTTTRSLTKHEAATVSWIALMRGQAMALRDACTRAGESGCVLVLPNAPLELYQRGIYGYPTALPTMTQTDPAFVRGDVTGLTVEADFS